MVIILALLGAAVVLVALPRNRGLTGRSAAIGVERPAVEPRERDPEVRTPFLQPTSVTQREPESMTVAVRDALVALASQVPGATVIECSAGAELSDGRYTGSPLALVDVRDGVLLALTPTATGTTILRPAVASVRVDAVSPELMTPPRTVEEALQRLAALKDHGDKLDSVVRLGEAGHKASAVIDWDGISCNVSAPDTYVIAGTVVDREGRGVVDVSVRGCADVSVRTGADGAFTTTALSGVPCPVHAHRDSEQGSVWAGDEGAMVIVLGVDEVGAGPRPWVPDSALDAVLQSGDLSSAAMAYVEALRSL